MATLNEAVVYKRQGDYDKAIKTYQDCLLEYATKGTNVNVSKLYMGLGKVFALKKNRDMAELCYAACLFDTLNLDMFHDYKLMRSGISSQQAINGFTQFIGLYQNLSYHIGALFILQSDSGFKEEYNHYLESIKGNSVATGTRDEEFTKKCISIGFRIIDSLLDRKIDDAILNQKLSVILKAVINYR